MYRYIFDYWSENYIYEIKKAIDQKDIEYISDFLKNLKRLDYPIILIINDVNNNTKEWHQIASLCSRLGIKLLVSIRHEDWFRFNDLTITNYEIIQPFLDLSEAKEIYNNLNKNNHVHEDVISSEWAYEKLEEPKLLIEYIYLITHGQMLKDKLYDQIKNIHNFDDVSKDKIELLRRISVADMLSSPLNTKSLEKNINSNYDLQILLESLKDEYIEIKDGIVSGIHWIRSKHIAQILHNDYTNLTDTAIKILDDINFENLDTFISNCIQNKDIDEDEILKYLKNNIQKITLKELKRIFKGLFIGGENLFYNLNKKYFDEIFNLQGYSSIFIIGSSLLPINNYNALKIMKETLGENENIKNIEKLLINIKKGNRGFNLCKDFFKNINKEFLQQKINEDILSDFPDIFHWLKYAEISLDTKDIINKYKVNDFEEIDIENIKYFLSGLYEYDKNTYFSWFEINKMDFIYFLAWKTNSLELKISEVNKIEIKYISFINKESSNYNNKSVKRIKILRETLPFLEEFSIDTFDFDIFGITPSVDKAYKNISIEKLPLTFVTDINRLWDDILENYYIPDNYYFFEQKWFELRNDIIMIIEKLNNWLNFLFLGNNKNNLLEEIDKINIIKKIDIVPKLPSQTEENIKIQFDKLARDADTHFRFFFLQLTQYPNNKDISNTCLHNLNTYIKNLSNLYKGFKLLFDNNIPDYFQILKLKDIEIKRAERLADLINIFFKHWNNKTLLSFEEIIIKEKDFYNKQIIEVTKEVFKDQIVFINENLLLDYPLTYIFIAFNVEKPLMYLKGLINIIRLLNNIKITPTFYYLLPVFKGNRIFKGAFLFTDETIKKIAKNEEIAWEAFVPKETDDRIKTIISKYPYNEIIELSFINEFNGFILSIIHFIEIFKLTNIDDSNKYIKKIKNKINDYYNSLQIELIDKAYKFLNKYKSRINEIKDIFKDIDINLDNIINIFNDISLSKSEDFLEKIKKYSDLLIKNYDNINIYYIKIINN